MTRSAASLQVGFDVWKSILGGGQRRQFRLQDWLYTGDVECGVDLEGGRQSRCTAEGFTILTTSKGPTNRGASFFTSTRRGRSFDDSQTL